MDIEKVMTEGMSLLASVPGASGAAAGGPGAPAAEADLNCRTPINKHRTVTYGTFVSANEVSHHKVQ